MKHGNSQCDIGGYYITTYTTNAIMIHQYYTPSHTRGPKSPQFSLNFLIHTDVVMICREFELIPT